jgi:adenylate cyclase
LVGDLDEGAAYIDRALALNPNLAPGWIASSLVRVWLGEPEMAIQCAARAMRLSPQDPLMFIIQAATAAGHFFSGRHGEALSWAETSIREHPGYIPSTAVAAAAGTLAGNNVAAARAMAQLRQIDPKLRISNLRELWPIRKAENFDQWAEGLRKGGLPE